MLTKKLDDLIKSYHLLINLMTIIFSSFLISCHYMHIKRHFSLFLFVFFIVKINLHYFILSY